MHFNVRVPLEVPAEAAATVIDGQSSNNCWWCCPVVVVVVHVLLTLQDSVHVILVVLHRTTAVLPTTAYPDVDSWRDAWGDTTKCGQPTTLLANNRQQQNENNLNRWHGWIISNDLWPNVNFELYNSGKKGRLFVSKTNKLRKLMRLLWLSECYVGSEWDNLCWFIHQWKNTVAQINERIRKHEQNNMCQKRTSKSKLKLLQSLYN